MPTPRSPAVARHYADYVVHRVTGGTSRRCHPRLCPPGVVATETGGGPGRDQSGHIIVER